MGKVTPKTAPRPERAKLPELPKRGKLPTIPSDRTPAAAAPKTAKQIQRGPRRKTTANTDALYET